MMGVLLLSFGGHAQGVDFSQLSYEEALQLATKEKKMVFIDFYTTWCGPCKQMTKDVFPQKEVGEFFNQRFVCLKMDAEKGEGKELAAKLKVRAYPTFVVLKANGEEAFRTSGALPAARFIEKIRKGIDPKWSPDGLTKRYRKGERTPELVYDYAIMMMENGAQKEGYGVVNDYFNSLSAKKRTKPENFFLYTTFTMNLSDEKALYMLDNKERFVSTMGRDTVEGRLYNWLRITYIPFVTLRSAEIPTMEGLQKVRANVAKAGMQDYRCMQALDEIAEIRVSGDRKQYVETCIRQFPKLDKPNRFSILINLGELKGETEEVKTLAAGLIRDYLSGVDERLERRILKTIMYDLEGKKEYNLQIQLDGAENGKAVVTAFTRRNMLRDTFDFKDSNIHLELAGKDTMNISLRIISENLANPSKNLGIQYPYISLIMVPGEFAVLKAKVEKGKTPLVQWVRGSEISHDFVRLNYELTSPEELAYRQLTIDNVVRGGDIREYTAEFDAYAKANRKTIMDFIRDNQKSFITAINLVEHYNWFDENEVEEIYNQFPESLKNTVYGRVLRQRLDGGRAYRIGTMAADFVKKDMKGKAVKLGNYKGKYVLLDFWGSWCGPCRASHPHLKELHKKYGKQVVFINVANENTKDLDVAKKLWKKAVQEDGLTWTQILNNEDAETYDLVKLYHVTAFPTKILIGPDGRIVSRLVGANADPEKLLSQLVGKDSVQNGKE